MKSVARFLILIIIFCLIVGGAMYLFSDNILQNSHTVYDFSEVGSDENGTVYKTVTGNNNSDEIIGIIIGIHPKENAIHKAVNDTFYQLCGAEDAPNNLTKKYIIYYVVVNDNITDRDESRTAGENLGSAYVVPNIVNDNVSMVIDIHMMGDGYDYKDFIFSIGDNPVAEEYANFIANNLNIPIYNFTEGTSPQKITIPIADTGIPTVLIEFDENMTNPNEAALNLINTLESLKLTAFKY